MSEQLTQQIELVEAALRVVRLSRPGTIQRFFTVMSVANETGLRGSEIVKAIIKLRKRKRAAQPGESAKEGQP